MGLDVDELRPVRIHSNAVFLLPRARIIVRVGRGAEAVERAMRAVEVSRWLAGEGFPTVVPVAGIEQPIVVYGDQEEQAPVTFWEQADICPDPNPAAAAAELGWLLRRLHTLRPPVVLPRFRPLDRLIAAARSSNWLNESDRLWIDARAVELQRSLDMGEFRLGAGLVHGDAQLGNVISTRTGPVLADWDNAAVAPREWDLVPSAAEERFGGPSELLTHLLAAYDADPTTDPGWEILRDIYELRSVAAHIRRAPSSPPHAREAALRIASLRAGDRTVCWSAVG
ncbi:phosphotransferase family protein [Micromonospora qiuiae]|uniref:phosphotransferase family protein n=1 Tax=Micromonospora qiuiae TaxID=502268 RepID=UPI00195294C2|nr:aminoglycoside phosphotransferase family protein [Micromonospora qiuiae]